MSTTTTDATSLHPLLQSRWSPRAFHPDAEISPEELETILEAARWTPSAANLQPWRFIVARRGSTAFASIVASLARGNAPWAQDASVLVVAAATIQDEEGKPMPWAVYDLGQSVAHLTLQAHALGYHAHQMGGFDAELLRGEFHLPQNLSPVTVIALGTVADPERLPERYRERETAPRVRKGLEEIVLVND